MESNDSSTVHPDQRGNDEGPTYLPARYVGPTEAIRVESVHHPPQKVPHIEISRVHGLSHSVYCTGNTAGKGEFEDPG